MDGSRNADKPKMKVAILARSDKRYEGFKALFDASVFQVARIPTDADFYESFARAEKEGAAVTVVASGDLEDPVLAEDAILRYSCQPPRDLGQMRFIFLAPRSMGPGDPTLDRLISVGVYDIILPSRIPDETAFKLIPSMAVHPQRFFNVAMFSKRIAYTSYDPSLAPAAKGSGGGPEVAASLSASRGRQRIAVAGADRHCGTSTAAMAISKSLLLAGYTVSLVIESEKDFSALKNYYGAFCSKDGSYRICPPSGKLLPEGGIDVFHGHSVADTHKQSQFCVFDMGYIDLRDLSGVPESPELASARVLRDEWYGAETQVLVSLTGPKELMALHGILMDTGSKRELGKWSVLLNLSGEEALRRVSSGMKPYIPNMGVFVMDEIHDPLAIAGIPGWVEELFEHTTNGDKLTVRGKGR